MGCRHEKISRRPYQINCCGNTKNLRDQNNLFCCSIDLYQKLESFNIRLEGVSVQWLKDILSAITPPAALPSFVKISMYGGAFLQLQVELSMNRKTSHLSYSKLCTKDYLKQLPPSLARVVFMVKTGMLDIKTNHKNKYCENLN